MSLKICVVTGSRSEYGLLYRLLKEIEKESCLNLQMIATCMHLAPEFGLTVKQIEDDGFHIDKKIEMLLSSDSPTGVIKSMGVGMIGFADAFEELQPDLLLILGDRFEALAVASAAVVARIPIAHIHGGEITEGAMDDLFRHAITKLSHLHFTSTEIYRKRVIQLGEEPCRVFNVGSLGVENIHHLDYISQDSLEDKIGIKLGVDSILVTFHPVTAQDGITQDHFQQILYAIDQVKDLRIVFTYANSDPQGRQINEMINDYVAKNYSRARVFDTLGQLLYINTMRHVGAVVGNSSSGIIETPSLKTITINIGERQAGRISAKSVYCCKPCKSEIVLKLRNIRQYYTEMSTPEEWENPYDFAGTTKKIIETLREKITDIKFKKKFYNLPDEQ